MRAFEIVAELWRQTWANLSRNKLRSFLTMFGIAWGVLSLALMSALGDGFKVGQRENWKQIGNDIVILLGGRTERHGAGQTSGRRVRLLESDLAAIRQQCPAVRTAAGEVKRYETPVGSAFNSGRFLVVGVTPEYLEIRNLPVESGRQINRADVREARRVCVLGFSVRKHVFEDRADVLGREVRIKGVPYTIVGLMGEKRQNSSFDGWDNDKVVIPATSLRRDCPPNNEVSSEGGLDAIVYQPSSASGWKTAQREAARVLGRLHNFDPEDPGALHIIDYVEVAARFDKTFESTEAFLAFVSLVTLTLGGIGIMNTMMMAVSERTNEIGLKKALGATRRRVLADFFLEGLLLSILSGAGGMAFVALIASAVNSIPKQPFFGGLPVEPRTLAMALGSLGTVAVLSSLPPAWRAARLTPVEALRHER